MEFCKKKTFSKLNFLLLKNIEAVLDKETIQNAINVANLNAEKSNKCKFINNSFEIPNISLIFLN